MKLIRPASITDATLTASNVAETDAPAWSASKSGGYAKGDRVLDAHHVWEWLSATAGNTTVAPSADTSTPAKWLDTGASNRWKMFDKKAGNKWLIGTSTANPTSINVTIKPGSVVNAIGLFGLVASSVQVIMTDPTDGKVYDKTIKLANTGVLSWYDYFFMPIDRAETAVKFDLPAYGTASVQVIVTNPGATAEVGLLVLGQTVEIGTSVYGTSVGIQSYSTTTEDDFGNVTIVSRGSRRLVDYDVRIPTEDLSTKSRILNQLRDTPCVYVGYEGMEATITVGRFENLSINISNPAFCEASAEVRSLA